MNRIISLFLFIFIASCLNGQYNSPIRNKVTLGKQTTADGLVWRGLRADTASKIVPFSDTSAYIILDTVEKTLWLYKAGQVPKWQQVGGSTLDTATMLLPYWRSGNFSGVLPVLNGGTNRTTMPNNYILFGDGNGIDTSNQLFWDRTNNRLGVGTNNPIYKLDVQGSSNTVNMRMASNTANDILLYFTGNVTGDINMFQSAVNATGSVSAQFVNANTATGSAFLNMQVPNTSTGDPFLQFTTSGATNYSFGIDNSDSDKFKFHSAATPSNNAIAIYTLTTDGKFGIQTESPSEVLHVVGNARIMGNIAAGVTSATAGLHLAAGTATASTAPLKFTSGVALTTPEVGAMEFSNISGTNRLLISPADNVRKEIAYTDFTNASGVLPIANGGTGTSAAFTAGSVVFAGASGTYAQDNSNLFWDDSNNRLGIGTTAPAQRLNVKGSAGNGIALTHSNNTIIATLIEFSGAQGAGLVLKNSSGTQNVLLNAGGDSYINGGNVGIGTASPGYTLQIKNSDASATVSSADGTAEMRINAQSGLAILETITNTDLRIRTNSTERMRITSGGNVGIGTTSPAKILTIAASSETWAGAPQVAFYDTFSGQVDARNWTVGAISTNFGNFTIASSTAAGGDPTTPRLTINKDGNVGIGTASTTARLHVKGVDVTDSNFALKVEDSNNLNLLSVKNNGDVTLKNPLSVANGGTGKSSLTANKILVGSGTDTIKSPTNLHWDNTNSWLGIGTSSPTSTLDVRGEINQKGTGNVSNIFESTTNTGRFIQSYSNDVGAAFQQGIFGSNNSQTLFGKTANNIAFIYTTTFVSTHPSVFAIGTLSNQDLILGTNNTQRILIERGGAVTINNLAGTNSRTVLADANGLLSAPTSSIMTKENVQVLNYGLNEILQFNPVSFDYIDKNKWGDERNLGFIVEDMYSIVPEVTGTMNNGDMYLDMVKLIPVLTKAIQEQQALIKALEQRIINLENK